MTRNANGEPFEAEQGIRVEPYGFRIAEVPKDLYRSRFAIIDDDWGEAWDEAA